MVNRLYVDLSHRRHRRQHTFIRNARICRRFSIEQDALELISTVIRITPTFGFSSDFAYFISIDSGWFGPSELKAFDPVSAEKAKSSLKKGNALRTALSEALDPSLIAHRASAVVLEEDDDHAHDEDDAFNQESAPRKKAAAKPKKTKADTSEKKKKGSTTDDSTKRKPAKRAVAADDDDEDEAPKVREPSDV